MNRNNIGQITIFANRNNIHEIKLLQIGIGIYSWTKYQGIDSWQMYLKTICELFANRELFAKHWNRLKVSLPCVFFCGLSGLLTGQMTYHIRNRQKGFSTWCLFKCFTRLLFPKKNVPHWGHEGFLACMGFIVCVQTSRLGEGLGLVHLVQE